MNEVVPIRAVDDKHVDAAWHIYCALSQYHAANPAVSDLPDYGQAVLDAHNYWGLVFGK
jgi:hypothetical protein